MGWRLGLGSDFLYYSLKNLGGIDNELLLCLMSSCHIRESSSEPGLGQEFETTYKLDQRSENQDRGILDQRGERIRSSEIIPLEDHLTCGNYNHTFNHHKITPGKPNSRPILLQKRYDSNSNEIQTTATYTSLRSEIDPGASVKLRDLSAPRLHTLESEEELNSRSTQISPGLITTLRQMMTALLRSSPAAGASSYGALPAIPIGSEDTSSLEEESVSDEDIGRGCDRMDYCVGQVQDRLYSERGEVGVVGATPTVRKRSGVMGAEMLGPSRALGEGLGESLGISTGPGLDLEVTEEDEQYDANDPPDNSPYVNPL